VPKVFELTLRTRSGMLPPTLESRLVVCSRAAALFCTMIQRIADLSGLRVEEGSILNTALQSPDKAPHPAIDPDWLKLLALRQY